MGFTGGTDQHGRARAAEIVAVAAILLALAAAGTALASRAPARPAKALSPKPVSTAKCVDSFDAACGPLHWVPAPGPNRPTETSLTPASASAVAGQPVSFRAAASDDDAAIVCHWILFGDEQAGLIPAISMQRQFGRWNTPAKHLGEFATSYTHTYAKPGTYRVQFGARSGEGCSNDYSPYAGESVSAATITVTAS